MEPNLDVQPESIDLPKKSFPTYGQGWALLGVLVIVSIIASLLMEGANSLTDLNIRDFTFAGSYVLIFGVTLLIALRWRGHSRLNFSAVDSRIYLPLLFVTLSLVLLRLPLIELIPMPEWIEELMDDLVDREWVFFIVGAIMAPVLEELLFRGVILDGFLKNSTPLKAILISSLIFGIAHLNPWQFISAFILGLLIGWVYWKTKSLIPCIFIHLVNNVSPFAAAYLAGDGLEEMENMEASQIPFYWYLISFVLTIAGIYYIYRVFQSNEERKALVENNAIEP